jgi:hypothetical protein
LWHTNLAYTSFFWAVSFFACTASPNYPLNHAHGAFDLAPLMM